MNLGRQHPILANSVDGFKLSSQMIRMAVFGFLIIATTLEVTGDAVVRLGIYNYAGLTRLLLMLVGAALLFGYGTSLNLAPLEFRRIVGLYIATLFIVWQIINFVFFRTAPNLSILVGGSLIVIGGLIVTFWKVT